MFFIQVCNLRNLGGEKMKKITLGLLSLLLIGIVAVGVSAFGMWYNNEDVRQAIEDNDYGAWKDAINEQLTEENFVRMREKHQKYGWKWQAKSEMRNAIQNNDYDAYVTAVEGFNKEITEEDFDILVQMHQAKQEGDYDLVYELKNQLGDFHGFSHHKGGCGRW